MITRDGTANHLQRVNRTQRKPEVYFFMICAFISSSGVSGVAGWLAALLAASWAFFSRLVDEAEAGGGVPPSVGSAAKVCFVLTEGGGVPVRGPKVRLATYWACSLSEGFWLVNAASMTSFA